MSSDKSEYISNWLYRANEDISVIKSLVKSGTEYYTSTICFHAQQACEKFLKAYLAYHDIDFPKTHEMLTLTHLESILPQQAAPRVWQKPRHTLLGLALEGLCPGSTHDQALPFVG